jgi:hypothetical protein
LTVSCAHCGGKAEYHVLTASLDCDVIDHEMLCTSHKDAHLSYVAQKKMSDNCDPRHTVHEIEVRAIAGTTAAVIEAFNMLAQSINKTAEQYGELTQQITTGLYSINQLREQLGLNNGM